MGTLQNPLSMSDEEIQGMMSPPSVQDTEEVEENLETDTETREEELETSTPDPDDSAEGTDTPDSSTEEEIPSGEGDGGTKEEEEEEVLDPESKKPEEGKDSPSTNVENTEGTGDKGSDTQETNYKAFYEQVMAPFNANGRTIQLNSPDEVIQLMQMGANYTRKMQAIAPHRKILLMLENNKLLDEDKLSYLIDIDKKNPDAIKKLVKDAGIDPMEIDTEEEPTYLVGNHRVSDEEAAFRATLEDIGSTPGGKETLQLINSDWDHASKEVLWSQPEVMQVIHEQRSNGIYDRISTELHRQRTLGLIPPQVPFLQAYKKIGEDMAQAGAFNDLVQGGTTQQQQQRQDPPAPVATRVSTPKPAASNGDKVSAASPSRSTPRKVTTVVNPLSLPDDEFEKQFAKWQGRV